MERVEANAGAESFLDVVISTIATWWTRLGGTNEQEALDQAVRRFTNSIVDANNREDLQRAFATAVMVLPEFLHELSRVRPIAPPHPSAAIDKLPWLMQRTTSDLDENVAREFLALLQLVMHVGDRLMRDLPPELLERLAQMHPEDIRVAQRDANGAPIFEAFVSLFALSTLHERLGRKDTWRREWVLEKGLQGLRTATSHLPDQRSFDWFLWMFRTLRRLGLWRKDMCPSTDAIEAALQDNPPNRSALEALRDRVGAAQTLVYVGDIQHTFEELTGGEAHFQALFARLEAGEQYMRGDLTIDRLAQRWSGNVPDTLALLEQFQFARPLATLRLAETDRQSRLSKLRADRLARGGEPAFDPEAVRRDVIASQRIEGVDARTHFTEASRGRS